MQKHEYHIEISRWPYCPKCWEYIRVLQFQRGAADSIVFKKQPFAYVLKMDREASSSAFPLLKILLWGEVIATSCQVQRFSKWLLWVWKARNVLYTSSNWIIEVDHNSQNSKKIFFFFQKYNQERMLAVKMKVINHGFQIFCFRYVPFRTDECIKADTLPACKWTNAYEATEVLDVAWQFCCKINPVTPERGVKIHLDKTIYTQTMCTCSNWKIPLSRPEMGNFICFYRSVLQNLDDAEVDDTLYAVSCRNYIQSLNIYFHFLKHV